MGKPWWRDKSKKFLVVYFDDDEGYEIVWNRLGQEVADKRKLRQLDVKKLVELIKIKDKK